MSAPAVPAAVRPAVLAGVGFMLLAMFMFSANDVLGKWLVSSYSVGQLLLVRSAAALLILAPFLVRQPPAAVFRPAEPRLQVLRVVLSTAEVGFFYWCVFYMPLADAMTYWLAGPLYVVVMSALFLGERPTIDRWIAVAVGFVGVLVVLRPSPATLGLPALIALAGSIFFAAFMVVTKRLSGTPDTVLVGWQTFAALVAGAVFAPIGWQTPSVRDLALLALLGVVSVSAHVAVSRSLKLAPAAVVAPYQYTLLLWAIVFGWLVFGDVPDLPTLVGGGIVIVSGLYLISRDARGA